GGVDAGETGVTCDGEGVAHAGHTVGGFGHASHDLFGAVEGGGVRHLEHGDQVTAVLLRDKAGGRAFESDVGQVDELEVDDQGDDGEANDAVGNGDVAGGERAQHAVKDAEKPAEDEIEQACKPILLSLARLEEERGHGGAEGQRIDGRENGRDGNGEGELAIELTGDAADEGDGDEDGGKSEGDGDGGGGRFFHR